MTIDPVVRFRSDIEKLSSSSDLYATTFVEKLLALAIELGASDIHLQPTAGKLTIDLRIDGVLQSVGLFSAGTSTDIIARLKVLAKLLTYRTDVPQEGRLHDPAQAIEMRISTFPTMAGERAVVRLFAPRGKLRTLGELEFSADVLRQLHDWLAQSSGAILLTGPAGSGKSTTAYAALRHVASNSTMRRSILTLEDPIEVVVEGAVQSQVQPSAGFTLATGLRSLLRQDPEVIMVGEVRDRETVETLIQASLTGHLVVSTFHAGSTADALCRLLDLGIEPYLVRSAIRGLWHQRLLRRRATESMEYAGRFPIVEVLPPLEGELAKKLLARSDAREIQQASLCAGMIPLRSRAEEALASGRTDLAEIVRVLGISAGDHPTIG